MSELVEPAVQAALRALGVDESDLGALILMLGEQGRWLVFVHQDHIVKVAKVEPEQVVKKAIGST